MSMSLRHFFKHFPYTLSRYLTHPPYQYAAPLSLLSTLSFRNYEPTNHSTPSPLFTKKFSISSSVYTSLDTPSSPAYLSVRIRCQKHLIDDFSEALLCFGASSTSVDEEDGCESSDEIFIDSIFPESEDVDTCISCAVDSIGLKEIPSYEVKIGDQYNWIQKTQESFHPVKVTEGLWIVPEWRTPPMIKKSHEDTSTCTHISESSTFASSLQDGEATNIILNPGLAFGTGEHPTTMLCLLLLQGLIKGGELFLDYGTGSGILAIAAIKFGAALSVGVDIDPQAITSASHNAAVNNIGPDKLKLVLVPDNTRPPSKDEREDGLKNDHNSYQTGAIAEIDKYDVVIANILLNPLLELADDIVSHAKPGAVVGISGILSEQLSHIIDRYSTLLEGISVSQMDDWACVSGTKTNPADS
ncbi:hypothetical protein Pint_04621 [Pistacia integerrima]|uniref:Uncharacterized protein n=1 Tax=Pistacia integerrima TaxID=434235 RepID=A0ACC0Z6B6_9ROSI|nr:hypothetical protein Pint_04621 [Pistacia integerrima]